MVGEKPFIAGVTVALLVSTPSTYVSYSNRERNAVGNFAVQRRASFTVCGARALLPCLA